MIICKNRLFKSLSCFVLSLALAFPAAWFTGGDAVYAEQLTDVKIVTFGSSARTSTSHAIDSQGSIWGWGLNTSGQLGDNSSINKSEPVKITTDSDGVSLQGTIFTSVSSSVDHTLALDEDGNVWSWGQPGGGGALGTLPSNNARNRPGKITVAMPAIKQIAAGYARTNNINFGGYSIALGVDGSLWGWGANIDGALGNGTSANKETPLQITQTSDSTPMPSLQRIATGFSCTYAVGVDGRLFEWGGGNIQVKPVKLSVDSDGNSLPNFTDVAAVGGNSSVAYRGAIALDVAGNMWTWGTNTKGELGHGDTTAVTTGPKKVLTDVDGAPLPPMIQIAAGEYFCMSKDIYGQVWTWGDNTNGRLGLGTTGGTVTSPTKVAKVYYNNTEHPVPDIDTIYANGSNMALLDTDGNLYIAGLNNTNQIGDGTAVDRNLARIPSFSNTGITFNSLLQTAPTTKVYKPNASIVTAVCTAPGTISDFRARYILMSDPNDTTDIDSRTDFEERFTAAESRNKGTMEQVAPRSSYKLEVKDNCKVWVMLDGKINGVPKAAIKSVKVTNFFTPISIYRKGQDSQGNQLYDRELITKTTGPYGLYYLADGTVGAPPAPLAVDTLNVIARSLSPYWTLATGGQPPIANLPIDDRALINKVYTFTYEKDPYGWVDVFMEFAEYETGMPIDVTGHPAGSQPVNLASFAPMGAPYVDGFSEYIPPAAANQVLRPIGYKVDNGALVTCTFPDEFNPTIDFQNQKITIVYSARSYTITENYLLADGTPLVPPKASTTANVLGGTAYSKTAPPVMDYVAVSSKLDSTSITGKTVSIPSVTADHAVTFFYKADLNNNGVPDDEESGITPPPGANEISVTIKGIADYGAPTQTELYTDTQNIEQGANPVTLPVARTIAGYELAAGQENPGHVIPDTNKEYIYEYKPVQTGPVPDADLQVTLKDSATSETIGTDIVRGIPAGTEYAYTVPDLTYMDYDFDSVRSGAVGGRVYVIMATNGSSIEIYYKKIRTNVTVEHYKTGETAPFQVDVVPGLQAGTVYYAQYADTGRWIYESGSNAILVKQDSAGNVIKLYYTDRNALAPGYAIITHMTSGSALQVIKTEIKTGITDPYNYDPSIEGFVRDILLSGYDLHPDSAAMQMVPLDSAIEIYYIPQNASVHVTYWDEKNQATLEEETAGAYVGQLFFPAIRYYSGYTFEGFEPDEGVVVSPGGNTMKVKYGKPGAEIRIEFINKASGAVIKFDNVLDKMPGESFSYIPSNQFTHDNHRYILSQGQVSPVVITVQEGVNIISVLYDDLGSIDGGSGNGIGGGDGGRGSRDSNSSNLPESTVYANNNGDETGDGKVDAELKKKIPLEFYGDDIHVGYLKFFDGNQFMPDAIVTRMEFASSLYLLDQNAELATGWQPKLFADVLNTEALTYLIEKGAISGDINGKFRPDDPITRAEAAVMIYKLKKPVHMSTSVIFTDLPPEHWAYRYVSFMAHAGWIQGYEDNTFRPNGFITRAELAVILNRASFRSPTYTYVPREALKRFSDLDSNHWAYWDIIEATTTHRHRVDEKKNTLMEVIGK